MTTITLPLNIAKALASMITFTGSDVDRLAYVYVDVMPSTVSALASDRYAIIESIYTERNGDGSLKFGISAPVAKFINGIKSKNTRESVEFTLIGTDLTVSALGVAGTFSVRLSDFGMVWAKFSELLAINNYGTHAEKAMPITLDVALLSRCAKLLTYDGKKAEKWEFHLGSETEQRKPTPIHAYSAGVITYHLLQQPLITTK